MAKRYPDVQVIDLDAANTEYPVVIPAHTKSYTVKTRGNNEFKLAYEPGQVEAANGEFITIPAGSAESEDDLGKEDAFTLYVSCEKGDEKLEVKIWG